MNAITEIKQEAQIEFENLSLGCLFKYPNSSVIFMKIQLDTNINQALNIQTGNAQYFPAHQRVVIVSKIILECC